MDIHLFDYNMMKMCNLVKPSFSCNVGKTWTLRYSQMLHSARLYQPPINLLCCIQTTNTDQNDIDSLIIITCSLHKQDCPELQESL